MPRPAIAETFLTSCQWAEGCLGGRKLALLPRHFCSSSWLLVSHFTWAHCCVLLPFLLAGPGARLLHVASELVHTHALTSSQCPGATPVPALLTSTQTQLLHWPQQTPGTEHLAHPTVAQVQLPHPATGIRNAALWILFPQKPTYLQEVAFPQLC